MTVELFRDLVTGQAIARFSVGGDWGDRRVSVVGSFNDWTPGVDILTPRRDGTHTGTVVVAEGEHVHFRYLASGDDWFDDPDADQVDHHGSHKFWPSDAAAPAAAKKTVGAKTAVSRTTAKKAAPAKAAPKAAAAKTAKSDEDERPRPKPAKKATAKKAAAKKTTAKKTDD